MEVQLIDLMLMLLSPSITFVSMTLHLPFITLLVSSKWALMMLLLFALS